MSPCVCIEPPGGDDGLARTGDMVQNRVRDAFAPVPEVGQRGRGADGP